MKQLLFIPVIILLSACARPNNCALSPASLNQVSTIRGLEFKSVVPCVMQSRSEVQDYIQGSLSSRNDPQRLVLEEQAYKLIGLIAPDFGYAKGLVAADAERVAGYYNFDAGHFVMVHDVPQLREKYVIMHELVHALQDQHFNLKAVMKRVLNNDEQLARSALLEGDANGVLHQIEHHGACKRLSSRELLEAMMRRAGSPIRSGPPRSLKMMMSFPYIYGESFVCALLEEGGRERLNQAFANLPVSSREVMEPGIYLKRLKDGSTMGSKPEGASPAPVSCAASDRSVFNDTLGEFGVFSLLSQFLPPSQALESASGLIQDCLTLKPDMVGHAQWKLSWGCEGEAVRFFNSLTQAYALRFKAQPFKSASERLFAGDFGKAEIRQQGTDVILEISSPQTSLS